MVGAGSILAGAHVRTSVIGPDVRVQEGTYVEGSVIMQGARIGRNAVVRRAIIDKGVVVPDGAKIGVDHVLDAQRFTVSPGGIVTIGKGSVVER
jgi:glucose-1-phosphate adenylyltransferase